MPRTSCGVLPRRPAQTVSHRSMPRASVSDPPSEPRRSALLDASVHVPQLLRTRLLAPASFLECLRKGERANRPDTVIAAVRVGGRVHGRRIRLAWSGSYYQAPIAIKKVTQIAPVQRMTTGTAKLLCLFIFASPKAVVFRVK